MYSCTGMPITSSSVAGASPTLGQAAGDIVLADHAQPHQVTNYVTVAGLHHHQHQFQHQLQVTADCVHPSSSHHQHRHNALIAAAGPYQHSSQIYAPPTATGQLNQRAATRHVTDRKKKTRTMFSNYQLNVLETTFQQSPYPDAHTRRELANRLLLDDARVQVWFQNRRAKWRKKASLAAQDHVLVRDNMLDIMM